MHYEYHPTGICASNIEFDIDNNGLLHDVIFKSGCPGNLKAISKLIEGKSAIEVANLLKGNTCGSKSTSCADRLATAIQEALSKVKE